MLYTKTEHSTFYIPLFQDKVQLTVHSSLLHLQNPASDSSNMPVMRGQGETTIQVIINNKSMQKVFILKAHIYQKKKKNYKISAHINRP